MKVFSFLSVVVITSLVLLVYLGFFKSNEFRKRLSFHKRGSLFIPRLPSLHLKHGGDKLLFGGGNGFDDRPPPDFRPRGGPFFFLFETPGNLLFFDLGWEKPEDLYFFPKQWYEDQDLALAWNAIMANQKRETDAVDEVNDCLSIKLFHYCVTILLTFCDK